MRHQLDSPSLEKKSVSLCYFIGTYCKLQFYLAAVYPKAELWL